MRRTPNKAKKNNVEKNSVEEVFEGALDSILGINAFESKHNRQEGVMEEGQEISFKGLQDKKAEEKEEKPNITAAIEYSREVIEVEQRMTVRDNQDLEVQLKQIMAEIKKLTDSSKELQMEFKAVAVEQYVVKPGKYHKNFFSWLLSLVRAARMKIEDSGAWLAALHSKKKSREYGAMTKKHGTSFSLSNERQVSTQVG
jgi:hypothetical protein